MRKSLIALGIAPLAALAISAGPALAGGAISKQKSPTSAQKTAILKAGGFKGPASCYSVQLSARKQTIAGAKFNEKARNCTKYAFDGAGLYYSTASKKTWFLLDAASGASANECDALQTLVGVVAWQDMIPYISSMGCQNFD
jgi:hypothetical protein